MALTISITSVDDKNNGDVEISGTVTFDSSYPTGGEVFDISDYISAIKSANFSGDDGYVIQHNRGTPAAGVLLAYEAGADAAALDEVADTTDLSSLISYFAVIGTGV